LNIKKYKIIFGYKMESKVEEEKVEQKHAELVPTEEGK
jgi:hypothetical protein